MHAITDSQEPLHPHPAPSFPNSEVLLNPDSQQPLHPETGVRDGCGEKGCAMRGWSKTEAGSSADCMAFLQDKFWGLGLSLVPGS